MTLLNDKNVVLYYKLNDASHVKNLEVEKCEKMFILMSILVGDFVEHEQRCTFIHIIHLRKLFYFLIDCYICFFTALALKRYRFQFSRRSICNHKSLKIPAIQDSTRKSAGILYEILISTVIVMSTNSWPYCFLESGN